MTEKTQQPLEIDFNFKAKIIGYAENLTWDEAQEWAKAQGGRLPTVEELQILSALQRMGKLNTNYRGWFWSADEYSDDPQGVARGVLFGHGDAYDDSKVSQGRVVCLGND